MNTLPRFDTDEVLNQSPPYEDIDLLCERFAAAGGGARPTAPAMRRRR